MSGVTVLLTGGTIGQRSSGGVAAPAADATAALVQRVCPAGIELELVRAMQRDSPDIGPAEWEQLAREVARAVRRGADGVVVLHGTDTLAHTAAALALALPGIGVPVVLTGSMRPGSDDDSDAESNLHSAFLVATSPLRGVAVVFTSPDDGATADILRGTRAVKRRTSEAAAFESVGAPLWGRVADDEVRLDRDAPRRTAATLPDGECAFSPHVDVVKVSPMTTGDRMRRLLAGLHGVVVEGFGAGHVPRAALDALAAFDGPVVVCSQVSTDHERLGMYASDRRLTDIPRSSLPGR
ncbi:asparaginase [Blastococcus brunescens]|uniref:Asparaginase domain-containing protein n=1 Tax=Blastococcus brunescens TaxID=1564165 RepID=A0ABZ1B3G4_9ACTN|nr:asparaginase domain-containing protein [Blastococcus sp. BMG 8361]WRL63595.1 asparaginase domain-containing protein [Blastococcus sp. BMG 8361]